MSSKDSARNAALALEIGRSIAALRKARGLTQEKLAENLKVERVSVSRMEIGQTLPSLSRLARIADELDTPLVTLLGSSEVAEAAAPPHSADRARRIAAMLERLHENDRELVCRWIEEMCNRLAKD
jgi:transcriptional regulator with XRE-family HTH domain